MKDLKKEKENLKRELTEKESQIKDLEVIDFYVWQCDVDKSLIDILLLVCLA
jgi:hypothetical protein